MRKFLASIALVLLICVSTSAQERGREASSESCAGPVYKHSEVSRPAAFSSRPSPSLTNEAIAHDVRGQVVLSAVLCSTGKVTDIQVLEGLPFGVTERAVEAARQTRFSPAEKGGQPVSVATRFVFKFLYVGERGPLAQGPLEGRLIESVEVGGYREDRWDDLDLWKRMKTLIGEAYNKEQIEQDWRMLLAAGDFDKEASTLRIEEGERGGIVVVFELRKKPKP
jgi:TonB family protein